MVLHASLLLRENCPWNSNGLSFEFEFPGGRTDILLHCGESMLVALEAKLKNWRKALNQAFRATSFAHKTYVLLPKPTALRAQRFLSEFTERSVGICSIIDDAIVVLHEAPSVVPILPGLTHKALSESSDGERQD